MNESKQKEMERPRNGSVTFYRANRRGTGAAVRLELRMNRGKEESYDCFFLEMANQKPDAGRGRPKKGDTVYDWAGKATVKLSFRDICEMVTVLEGKQDQVGNGQNGLYHQAADTNTLIAFKRMSEKNGYLLGVSKKRGSQELFKGHVLLNETEATGLRCLFQTALFFMVFNNSIQP
jgi:hypothetical protein